MISRPAASEYAPYFERYITLVHETDLLGLLSAQEEDLRRALARVRPDQELFRYAEGKWSIRQVTGHLTDAERVFGYRSFCISRGEAAPLPAFDEDTYVARSPFHNRPLAELVTEFGLVRRANLEFLHQLTPDQWLQTGTASNKTISVRAIAFIMAGHVRHHLSILRDRYGIS